MPRCLLSLGANLGQPADTFAAVLEELHKTPQVRVLSCSQWRQTAPIGGPVNAPPFLNGAVLLETTLPPTDVWRLLQRLELSFGRERSVHWGPRTLDLDLLLYDQLVLRTAELQIPHPRMAFRRFVLDPAAEIAPDMVHPTIGWSIRALLDHLDRPVDYLAITGADPLANASLTRSVAKRLDAGRLSGASTIILSSDVALVEIDAGSTKLHALMQREAELLDPSQSYDPAAVLLSDFWIEESLAVGRVVLEPRRQRELEKLWTEIRQRVIGPKLIVVLEGRTRPADDTQPTIHDAATRESGDRSQRYRLEDEIRQQAKRPDVGPVLCLEQGDMELAIEEVVAAALAMRR